MSIATAVHRAMIACCDMSRKQPRISAAMRSRSAARRGRLALSRSARRWRSRLRRAWFSDSSASAIFLATSSSISELFSSFSFSTWPCSAVMPRHRAGRLASFSNTSTYGTLYTQQPPTKLLYTQQRAAETHHGSSHQAALSLWCDAIAQPRDMKDGSGSCVTSAADTSGAALTAPMSWAQSLYRLVPTTKVQTLESEDRSNAENLFLDTFNQSCDSSSKVKSGRAPRPPGCC